MCRAPRPPRRAPQRVVSQPPGICIAAYPSQKPVMTMPCVSFVQLSSACITTRAIGTEMRWPYTIASPSAAVSAVRNLQRCHQGVRPSAAPSPPSEVVPTSGACSLSAIVCCLRCLHDHHLWQLRYQARAARRACAAGRGGPRRAP
jgi:hypothetical protein